MKILKKLSGIIMVSLMLCVLFAGAVLAEGEIGVEIEGKAVEFTDVKPIEKEGNIFIPLRAVFESVGADVFWEGETRTIISSLGENKVIMQIDNNLIFINSDGSYSMDFAPFIENDRTYIPFTAFSMAFGYGYNENGNVISFTK